MKTEPKTTQERTAKYNELHPQDMAKRQERCRYRKRQMMFHIKRNQRYPFYPLPEGIDIESDAYKSALAEYREKLAERVHVKERVGLTPISDNWDYIL